MEQDIFDKAMDDTIAGLNSVLHIRDDFIGFGKGNTEHDKALENLLRRFRECGLAFKPKKCKFRPPQIEFFGFVFSKGGIKPSASKVQALKQIFFYLDLYLLSACVYHSGLQCYKCCALKEYFFSSA